MKRNGGVILLLLVIAAIAFSFYRGYLTLSSSQQPATSNTEIKLTVDQNKAEEDAEEAGNEIRRMTENIDLNPVD